MELKQTFKHRAGVSILRYFSRTLLIIYSHFYKKLGPFYKKINCETMVTDHRPERTTMHLRTTYNALKRHLSACTLQNLIDLACSFSEDCAHSLQELFNFIKMRNFYKKKLPLFIKNYIDPTYKKLKPQISPFIKNSIFGNNIDPCKHVKSQNGSKF